jgi:hypothetical protein
VPGAADDVERHTKAGTALLLRADGTLLAFGDGAKTNLNARRMSPAPEQ